MKKKLESIHGLLDRIANELQALSVAVNDNEKPVEIVEKISGGGLYESPDVPDGYDTVVHYFSANYPTAFKMLDDPITGTFSDARWCSDQCRRLGLNVVTVQAPRAFEECGIEQIKAFPLSVLEEAMAA